MPETSATADALLHLVQQNQHSMDRVFTELEKLHNGVANVRERMVALEASSVQPQVSEVRTEVSSLRERVAILEGDKQTRTEVAKTQSTIAEWMFKLAPWIFVTVYIIWESWRKSLGG